MGTKENDLSYKSPTLNSKILFWELKRPDLIWSDRRVEMEREKRKKMSPGEKETKRSKKTRKEEREETEMEEPTTEEVEEFYAILRRMDVALRYLKGKRVVERRTTAETAVVCTGEGQEIQELNLNEVPADSTN